MSLILLSSLLYHIGEEREREAAATDFTITCVLVAVFCVVLLFMWHQADDDIRHGR